MLKKLLQSLTNTKSQKTYKITVDDNGDIYEELVPEYKVSNYVMGLDMVGAIILEMVEM